MRWQLLLNFLNRLVSREFLAKKKVYDVFCVKAYFYCFCYFTVIIIFVYLLFVCFSLFVPCQVTNNLYKLSLSLDNDIASKNDAEPKVKDFETKIDMLENTNNTVSEHETVSGQDDVTCQRFCTATMSYDRFTDILKYTRFDDPVTRKDGKSSNKLTPLGDVTSIFTKYCQESYDVSDIGCFNEQLITFRDHSSLKVHTANKPDKYETKIWIFCPSKTYYYCNTEVYLGKCSNAPEKQRNQRVAKELVNFSNDLEKF